jgi:hypothetical protein
MERTAVIIPNKPECFGVQREPLDPECQKCEIENPCIMKCIKNIDDDFRMFGV